MSMMTNVTKEGRRFTIQEKNGETSVTGKIFTDGAWKTVKTTIYPAEDFSFFKVLELVVDNI